jgi:Zn-finger nucleic acid-binding protein
MPKPFHKNQPPAHVENRRATHIGNIALHQYNILNLIAQASMKCPKCNIEMVSTTRYGLPMNYCPSCKGMWIEYKELEELEDEVFDFDDHDKGTLVFSSTPTTSKCPECGTPLRRFRYRLDDLELEFCENKHGYWLDAGEDTRILDLMQKKEADLQKKLEAEKKWGLRLNGMRSNSFFEKIREYFD